MQQQEDKNRGVGAQLIGFCLGIPVAVVLLFVTYLWWAWWAVDLWSWFIVPLGLPYLSTFEIMAIIVTYKALFSKISGATEKQDIGKMMISTFVHPIGYWLMGLIIVKIMGL